MKLGVGSVNKCLFMSANFFYLIQCRFVVVGYCKMFRVSFFTGYTVN